MARTEGTEIILLNSDNQVLLYLRDDNPDLLYPNMWALPGGIIEEGETPLESIVREIDEEMGIRLDPRHVHHLQTRVLDFGIEHTFITTADFDIEDITLTEGQALRWFTESEIAATALAYADNAILETFFESLTRTH
ncbi:NUDIX hydrolase [Nocardia takedensis]|uniref:NUDIX hydrolase n=1 Tax=Nocardia takedensis TaxID=259390 RepID=UPI00030A7274|nr:NUDIX hydrolase [Nocardia takedensis]